MEHLGIEVMEILKTLKRDILSFIYPFIHLSINAFIHFLFYESECTQFWGKVFVEGRDFCSWYV